MKKTTISLCIMLTFCLSGFAQADKIIGKWKTIDDKDGTAKSIVYIFKVSKWKVLRQNRETV
jgi:hypothetical protein